MASDMPPAFLQISLARGKVGGFFCGVVLARNLVSFLSDGRFGRMFSRDDWILRFGFEKFAKEKGFGEMGTPF